MKILILVASVLSFSQAHAWVSVNPDNLRNGYHYCCHINAITNEITDCLQTASGVNQSFNGACPAGYVAHTPTKPAVKRKVK